MHGAMCGRAAILLALGACRSAAPDAPMLSEEAVTLDLPIVRQDELHACGLAAITALCGYWNAEIPEADRRRLAVRADEAHGLSGGELREALEAAGLETFLFRGSLDRSETGLLRHVDAGRPPLVMLGRDHVERHYALVLGYDEPRDLIALLDPARGPVVRPTSTFLPAWEASERFTLLAVPRTPGESLPSGPRKR